MPGKDVTTMNKVILMGRLTKNPEIKYAGTISVFYIQESTFVTRPVLFIYRKSRRLKT